MQHVTIGACALSARTYNAEVQGSDARLRNHFVLFKRCVQKGYIRVDSVSGSADSVSGAEPETCPVNSNKIIDIVKRSSQITVIIILQVLTGPFLADLGISASCASSVLIIDLRLCACV